MNTLEKPSREYLHYNITRCLKIHTSRQIFSTNNKIKSNKWKKKSPEIKDLHHNNNNKRAQIKGPATNNNNPNLHKIPTLNRIRNGLQNSKKDVEHAEAQNTQKEDAKKVI
jgi:hypothetical protein